MIGLDLGAIVAHLRLDDNQYRRALGTAMSLTQRTLHAMHNAVFNKYTRRAAYAVTGVITASIKAYSSFEQVMANVSTMLDEQTMHYMPRFGRAVRDMSVRFGDSTKSLGKGLYDILSASIAPSQSLYVLENSAMAASAGITSTAVAADATTTILNAYQLEAKKAGDVSDWMFAVVKRGKITYEELAGGIGKVASLAALAGLSLDEVGASIATMTRAGMHAEISMTALRGIINTFLSPTEEAAKVAQKFDLQLNAISLRSLGLIGVLQKLKGATAEELAAIIPNIRASAGFAAQVQQVSKQVEDLEYILHRTGLTQEAFRKNTDTMSHAVGRFWQFIKNVGVGIGSRFRDDIISLTETLIANRRQIEMWAMIFAENVKFIGHVLWDLLSALRNDFTGNFMGVLDVFVDMMQAAAKVLIDLAIRTGKGIWKGMKEGIFGTSGEKASAIAMEVYKARGGPIKTIEQTGKGWGAWTERKEVAADAAMFERYKQLAEQSLGTQFADSVMTGFPERVKEIMGELKQDLKTGIGDVPDILGANMANLKNNILAIRGEFAWEDLKEGYSGAIETVVGYANKVKDIIRLHGKAAERIEATNQVRATEVVVNLDAAKSVQSMLNELRVEYGLLGKVNEERERAIQIIKFQEKAEEAYGAGAAKTAEVLQKYNELLDKIAAGKRGPAAFHVTMQNWANDATNIWQNVGDAMVNAFDRGAQSLTQMIMEGKGQFKDFAKVVIADLLTIMIRAQMAQAAMAFFPGMFGGANISTTPAGDANSMMANKAHNGLPYDYMPRLHSGLGKDEFPAIIQRGEEIIPKHEAGKSRAPSVVINNNTGQTIRQDGPAIHNGREWVVNLVTDVVLGDMAQHGPIAQMMEGVQGA